MKTLFLLAVVLGLAAATVSFNINVTYAGNITNPLASPDFSLRMNELAVIGTMITWSSLSITPGDLDAISTLAGAGSGACPWWLVSQAIVTSTSTSAAQMGVAFLKLVECNSAGAVVTTTLLKDLTWSTTNIDTLSAVKTATLTASVGTTGNIFITLIASNVVGIIDYAHAVVSPKSLQMVLEIDNYPYASSTNYLKLVFAAATASASVTGGALVSASQGASVYLTMAANAYVNGASRTLSFDAVTKGSVSTDIGISALAVAGFNSYVQGVTFPAGASQIVWDPSVGSGTPAYGGGGGSLGASATIKVSVLFIALLAAIAMML